jgi:pimeloyl-ACP methyl ester carboxylesterase
MGLMCFDGGPMMPRLVFVHGIGGSRQADVDRERWVGALARGAREAGHSRAAESLVGGSLVEVIFTHYGDLFQHTQAQGPGGIDLDEAETILLSEFLAEVVATHCHAADTATSAALTDALAQLRLDRQQQGIGDLVRRAINAATTLLGARPWRGAGQWASGKLLVRDLSQVARYLARSEPDTDLRTLDTRIRRVLAAALGPGPTVVIAHSLGTVVSFETLHECTSVVPLWVTLGSPLAMRAFVWPKVRPRPPATPDMVLRWLNYWDRDDIIAARPILESDVAANMAGVLPESKRVDSDGVWVHAATTYLAKADVAGPVMEAIETIKSTA